MKKFYTIVWFNDEDYKFLTESKKANGKKKIFIRKKRKKAQKVADWMSLEHEGVSYIVAKIHVDDIEIDWA